MENPLAYLVNKPEKASRRRFLLLAVLSPFPVLSNLSHPDPRVTHVKNHWPEWNQTMKW